MTTKATVESALAVIQHLGLGKARHEGVGIPGPYGDNPNQVIPADNYEISGTQVALRSNVTGAVMGYFNNGYGDNGGVVVGTPDQVGFTGQTASSKSLGGNFPPGLTWAQVVVESGDLTGQDGFVAVKYLAPLGWTAKNGGTAPAPSGGGGGDGGGETPPADMSPPKTNWKVPALIAAGVVVATGAAVAVAHARKKRRAHAHHG